MAGPGEDGGREEGVLRWDLQLQKGELGREGSGFQVWKRPANPPPALRTCFGDEKFRSDPGFKEKPRSDWREWRALSMLEPLPRVAPSNSAPELSSPHRSGVPCRLLCYKSRTMSLAFWEREISSLVTKSSNLIMQKSLLSISEFGS